MDLSTASLVHCIAAWFGRYTWAKGVSGKVYVDILSARLPAVGGVSGFGGISFGEMQGALECKEAANQHIGGDGYDGLEEEPGMD